MGVNSGRNEKWTRLPQYFTQRKILLNIQPLLSLLLHCGVTVKLFADDVKLYMKIINQIDRPIRKHSRKHYLPLVNGLLSF